MQSFRTELENPIVEQDILDLQHKIQQFHAGAIDPEKFRSLRLARGVYGQRQQGVQMVRIKIPYGRFSTHQLRRLATLSDKYATGNLHLTTRQDVQFHFVSLDDTPALWAELEQSDLTLREACGNTVRNITASPEAGIDPNEPFDVTPYADFLFKYFLRNPVGQDMGRKIKIAFSSSEADSAFTFMHDIGFIPRVEIVNGNIRRGFKVVTGGGLGAQPFPAQIASEFLPENEIVPFTEALLRVFDRHGERNNRNKARLKYLLSKIGIEELLRLVHEEKQGLAAQHVDIPVFENELVESKTIYTTFKKSNSEEFDAWKLSSVIAQKQPGYVAVHLRIPRGDLSSASAIALADVIDQYARASDSRITPQQSILLRFVPEAALPALYQALKVLGLHLPGGSALGDITSCPGTDTCNLGISNSTGVAAMLEDVITNEYPHLIGRRDLTIKISGCMNSCGQHALADIGFHGSSIKIGSAVAPALQLVLGGGQGIAAEKIIKFPSKRAPAVLRVLINDFESNASGESFREYFLRHGKMYFYQLLKAFGETDDVKEDLFIDWNADKKFALAVGVGECAGVKIDLVATLLHEAEEAVRASEEQFKKSRFADAAYHAYNGIIHAAKAVLLDSGIQVNSQFSVISEFQSHFGVVFGFADNTFTQAVLKIKEQTPTKDFAQKYLQDSREFVQATIQKRLANQKIINTN
jgi:sulfite reductase (ferredoxin)